MKVYEKLAQFFLLLGFLGWIGWMVTRFTGPLLKISHEGMHVFTITALTFAIAISLIKIAFIEK